jgi:hypothetical protein
MRASSIILGLMLGFHVSAQRNNGDSSGSAQNEMLYHTTAAEISKRYHWKRHPVDPWSSFIASVLGTWTADSQTYSTKTATQPTVQPTVQPSEQQTQQASTPQSAVPEPASTPSGATQSCHAINHGWWISYDVLIRVPFGGKEDCDATYKSLEDNTHSITNWHCENKDGYIHLYFNTAHFHLGDEVSNALKSRYPSVNSFNCPDY